MAKCTFLDLSAGHLAPATRTWLDQQGLVAAQHRLGSDPYPAFFMGSTPYGWLCWAGMEDDADNLLALPADLQACIRRAKAEGCDYILFDADGDAVDGLPTFAEER